MNSWTCSSIPEWFYSLHELFQIESDPFPQQIWFGISNSFTEGMTEGDSIRLVLTDTDLRDTFLFFKMTNNCLYSGSRDRMFEIFIYYLSVLIFLKEKYHLMDIFSKSCENHSAALTAQVMSIFFP